MTKQALTYVQIYEGTQSRVTKQALRFVQIHEGTHRQVTKQALRNVQALRYMKVPMKKCG